MRDILPKGLKGLEKTMPKDTARQLVNAAQYFTTLQEGPVTVMGTQDRLILFPEEFYRLSMATRLMPQAPAARDGSNPILIRLESMAIMQMGDALLDNDFKWAFHALNYAFDAVRRSPRGPVAVELLQDPRLDMGEGKAEPAIDERALVRATVSSLKKGQKAMIELTGVGVSTYEEATVLKVTKTQIFTDNGVGNDPTVFDRPTGAHENNGGIPGMNMYLRIIPPAGIPPARQR